MMFAVSEGRGLSVMRAKIRQRCPVLIDFDGDLIKSEMLASDAEQPAEVAIKLREKGWKPYRVRFDHDKAAWIVASLGRR